MQLVIFGFFGIIIIILFLFAEGQGKKILGVFASLLLLMLGVWCLSDPITFETGSQTTGSNLLMKTEMSSTTNGTLSTSSTSIITLNESTNSTYSPVSQPSYSPLSFSGLIALVLFLLGLFGMLHYGLSVGSELNES